MILDRYIHREILQFFVSVFSVLMLIAISIKYVRFLADAAAGKISSGLIYQMLILQILSALKLVVPLCLFLSIFFVLGRLRHENELTAMANAGLGQAFLLRKLLDLATVFSLISLVIALFIAPWADGKTMELKARANREADIAGIGAGRFKEFSHGNRVVYIEKISEDRSSVSNVFLRDLEAGLANVMTSDSARLETDPKSGDRYVVFDKGHRYTGQPGRLDYEITEYEKYAIMLESSEASTARKLRAIPTLQLWQSKDIMAIAELQWRISMPIATFILAVTALVMAQALGASSRHFGLILATVVYFLYNNLLSISRNMVKMGDLTPQIGLWWVHIMFCLIIGSVAFYPLAKRWRHRRRMLMASQ